MVTVSTSVAVLCFLSAQTAAAPSSSTRPRFLEEIRVVAARVSEGVVTFTVPGGELRSLREGDVLEEEGGAKLTDVTASTLVFTRRVKGGDGEEGEARIVVRYDAAGKTKVREFRSVSDVPQPRSPR
jgi:hypothetical protein